MQSCFPAKRLIVCAHGHASKLIASSEYSAGTPRTRRGAVAPEEKKPLNHKHITGVYACAHHDIAMDAPLISPIPRNTGFIIFIIFIIIIILIFTKRYESSTCEHSGEL